MTGTKLGGIFSLVALLGACAPTVQVADGDTIIVGATHYRLWGVEAPDLNQTCAEGWPAGLESKRMLRSLTDKRRISCEDRGMDRYRRRLGLCRAGGLDIGAEMVGAGMAWAAPSQTSAYVGIERDAREERRGVHAQNCRPAWQWRLQKGDG